MKKDLIQLSEDLTDLINTGATNEEIKEWLKGYPAEWLKGYTTTTEDLIDIIRHFIVCKKLGRSLWN